MFFLQISKKLLNLGIKLNFQIISDHVQTRQYKLKSYLKKN